MSDLSDSVEAALSVAVRGGPASTPRAALALVFVIAQLDQQLANHERLRSAAPDANLALALRREMLAIYMTCTFLAITEVLPQDQVLDLGRKLRLALDHFSSYSASCDVRTPATEETRKAQAYRAVVGASQIEPMAEEFATGDRRLGGVVYRYGAAATGTLHIDARLKHHASMSVDEPVSHYIGRMLLEALGALRIRADDNLLDALARQALQACEASHRLAQWFQSSRPSS